MNDRSFTDRRKQKEIEELLARTPVLASACELDLLVFLHRHPRTLLTDERLAALVGHDTKQIAQAIDAFIAAGLLEKTQNPMHVARMYLLVLDGPQGGGLGILLDIASTQQGRRDILQLLAPAQSKVAGDRLNQNDSGTMEDLDASS